MGPKVPPIDTKNVGKPPSRPASARASATPRAGTPAPAESSQAASKATPRQGGGQHADPAADVAGNPPAQAGTPREEVVKEQSGGGLLSSLQKGAKEFFVGKDIAEDLGNAKWRSEPLACLADKSCTSMLEKNRWPKTDIDRVLKLVLDAQPSVLINLKDASTENLLKLFERARCVDDVARQFILKTLLPKCVEKNVTLFPLQKYFTDEEVLRYFEFGDMMDFANQEEKWPPGEPGLYRLIDQPPIEGIPISRYFTFLRAVSGCRHTRLSEFFPHAVAFLAQIEKGQEWGITLDFITDLFVNHAKHAKSIPPESDYHPLRDKLTADEWFKHIVIPMLQECTAAIALEQWYTLFTFKEIRPVEAVDKYALELPRRLWDAHTKVIGIVKEDNTISVQLLRDSQEKGSELYKHCSLYDGRDDFLTLPQEGVLNMVRESVKIDAQAREWAGGIFPEERGWWLQEPSGIVWDTKVKQWQGANATTVRRSTFTHTCMLMTEEAIELWNGPRLMVPDEVYRAKVNPRDLKSSGMELPLSIAKKFHSPNFDTNEQPMKYYVDILDHGNTDVERFFIKHGVQPKAMRLFGKLFEFEPTLRALYDELGSPSDDEALMKCLELSKNPGPASTTMSDFVKLIQPTLNPIIDALSEVVLSFLRSLFCDVEHKKTLGLLRNLRKKEVMLLPNAVRTFPHHYQRVVEDLCEVFTALLLVLNKNQGSQSLSGTLAAIDSKRISGRFEEMLTSVSDNIEIIAKLRERTKDEDESRAEIEIRSIMDGKSRLRFRFRHGTVIQGDVLNGRLVTVTAQVKNEPEVPFDFNDIRALSRAALLRRDDDVMRQFVDITEALERFLRNVIRLIGNGRAILPERLSIGKDVALTTSSGSDERHPIGRLECKFSSLKAPDLNRALVEVLSLERQWLAGIEELRKTSDIANSFTDVELLEFLRRASEAEVTTAAVPDLTDTFSLREWPIGTREVREVLKRSSASAHNSISRVRGLLESMREAAVHEKTSPEPADTTSGKIHSHVCTQLSVVYSYILRYHQKERNRLPLYHEVFTDAMASGDKEALWMVKRRSQIRHNEGKLLLHVVFSRWKRSSTNELAEFVRTLQGGSLVHDVMVYVVPDDPADLRNAEAALRKAGMKKSLTTIDCGVGLFSGIRRLSTAMHDDQDPAIAALAANVVLVHGPPRSGKTSWITKRTKGEVLSFLISSDSTFDDMYRMGRTIRDIRPNDTLHLTIGSGDLSPLVCAMLFNLFFCGGVCDGEGHSFCIPEGRQICVEVNEENWRRISFLGQVSIKKKCTSLPIDLRLVEQGWLPDHMKTRFEGQSNSIEVLRKYVDFISQRYGNSFPNGEIPMVLRPLVSGTAFALSTPNSQPGGGSPKMFLTDWELEEGESASSAYVDPDYLLCWRHDGSPVLLLTRRAVKDNPVKVVADAMAEMGDGLQVFCLEDVDEEDEDGEEEEEEEEEETPFARRLRKLLKRFRAPRRGDNDSAEVSELHQSFCMCIGVPPDTDLNGMVVTRAAFVTLVRVALALDAGVNPLIVVGETGCGKTHGVTMVASWKNLLLFKLEVHAGTHIESASKDQPTIKSVLTEAKEAAEKHPNLRVVVFFDEINTSIHQDVLKQIMLDRRFRHENKIMKIPDNIAFVAGCNPYRVVSHGDTRRLAYRVQPAVHPSIRKNLCIYHLYAPSEEAAIFATIMADLRDAEQPDVDVDVETIAALVPKCHALMRKYCPEIPVSIRNMKRVARLTLELWRLSEKKPELFALQYDEGGDPLPLSATECGHVAVCVTYFICLQVSRKVKDEQTQQDVVCHPRQEFRNDDDLSEAYAVFEKVCNAFRRCIPNLGEVDETPTDSPSENGNTTPLSPGRKNRERTFLATEGLKESLFVEFLAIVSSTSLVLVGSPGSSKSLTLFLLLEAWGRLDGPFHDLPLPFPFMFQCAVDSRADVIEELYQKAKVFQQRDGAADRTRTVAFFDELALAHEAPHNPLKVLNGWMDREGQPLDPVTVGTTNFLLDLSQMNRALVLMSPAPDVDALHSMLIHACPFLKESPHAMDLATQISRDVGILGVVADSAKHEAEGTPGMRSVFAFCRDPDARRAVDHTDIYQLLKVHFGVEHARRFWRVFPVPEPDCASTMALLQSRLRGNGRRFTDGFRPVKISCDSFSELRVVVESARRDRDVTYVLGSMFAPDPKCTPQITKQVTDALKAGNIVVLVQCGLIFQHILDIMNAHFIDNNGYWARVGFAGDSVMMPIHRDAELVVATFPHEVQALVEQASAAAVFDRLEPYGFEEPFPGVELRRNLDPDDLIKATPVPVERRRQKMMQQRQNACKLLPQIVDACEDLSELVVGYHRYMLSPLPPHRYFVTIVRLIDLDALWKATAELAADDRVGLVEFIREVQHPANIVKTSQLSFLAVLAAGVRGLGSQSSAFEETMTSECIDHADVARTLFNRSGEDTPCVLLSSNFEDSLLYSQLSTLLQQPAEVPLVVYVHFSGIDNSNVGSHHGFTVCDFISRYAAEHPDSSVDRKIVVVGIFSNESLNSINLDLHPDFAVSYWSGCCARHVKEIDSYLTKFMHETSVGFKERNTRAWSIQRLVDTARSFDYFDRHCDRWEPILEQQRAAKIVDRVTSEFIGEQTSATTHFDFVYEEACRLVIKTDQLMPAVSLQLTNLELLSDGTMEKSWEPLVEGMLCDEPGHSLYMPPCRGFIPFCPVVAEVRFDPKLFLDAANLRQFEQVTMALAVANVPFTMLGALKAFKHSGEPRCAFLLTYVMFAFVCPRLLKEKRQPEEVLLATAMEMQRAFTAGGISLTDLVDPESENPSQLKRNAKKLVGALADHTFSGPGTVKESQFKLRPMVPCGHEYVPLTLVLEEVLSSHAGSVANKEFSKDVAEVIDAAIQREREDLEPGSPAQRLVSLCNNPVNADLCDDAVELQKLAVCAHTLLQFAQPHVFLSPHTITFAQLPRNVRKCLADNWEHEPDDDEKLDKICTELEVAGRFAATEYNKEVKRAQQQFSVEPRAPTHVSISQLNPFVPLLRSANDPTNVTAAHVAQLKEWEFTFPLGGQQTSLEQRCTGSSIPLPSVPKRERPEALMALNCSHMLEPIQRNLLNNSGLRRTIRRHAHILRDFALHHEVGERTIAFVLSASDDIDEKQLSKLHVKQLRAIFRIVFA